MHRTATRSRRGLRPALAALLAAGTLLAATPGDARAHDGTLPPHDIGGVSCGVGEVRAYPPRVMESWRPVDLRHAELVLWRPVLERWDGRAWVVDDSSASWHHATTSMYGFALWDGIASWLGPNWAQTVFVPYRGLPTGYYRVANQLWWDAGQHLHVEPSGYCHVA